MQPVVHTEDGLLSITSSFTFGAIVALVSFGCFIVAFPFLFSNPNQFSYFGTVFCFSLRLVCIATAFTRSQVTLNFESQVLISTRHWGLFRFTSRQPLENFHRLTIRGDESDTQFDYEVRLRVRNSRFFYPKETSIIWSRSREDTRRMAAIIADKLSLSLEDLSE